MQAVSTTCDGKCTTFRISGDLSGDAVAQLENLWRNAPHQPRQVISVDLRRAQRIDEQGKHLLCEMFGNGIELVVPVRNRKKRL